jgi:Kef-type K+ transport system membrane component KefB
MAFAGAAGVFQDTSAANPAPDSSIHSLQAEVHGENPAQHSDPFAPIILELALVIICAVFGRWVAAQLNMASVLGELLIGVVIGNIGYYFQEPVFILVMHLDSVRHLFEIVWSNGLAIADAAPLVFSAEELAPGGIGHQIVWLFTHEGGGDYVTMAYALWIFSNLGVILLLFMVGLESSVPEMLKVGPKAFVVAVVGVVLPFALGFGTSILLLEEASTPAHLFLGATLCATSVGITARVFQDLKKIHTAEAKVILGAAVIDDVLGLIILAIVVGIVATGSLDLFEVGKIVVISIVFLGVAILFGERIFHWIIRRTARFEKGWIKLLYPLTLALLMSWLASILGLAAIVGAFVAGLLLKDEYFGEGPRFHMRMEELVSPLEKLFAPVFFVLMGMQVNLETLTHLETLLLSVGFIVVAIIGKLLAGYSIKGLDRLSVGIGMVPRGEVGLIFASIGKGLGVVNEGVFSAIVIMVMVTTLVTPVALKWSLARFPSQEPPAEPVA